MENTVNTQATNTETQEKITGFYKKYNSLKQEIVSFYKEQMKDISFHIEDDNFETFEDGVFNTIIGVDEDCFYTETGENYDVWDASILDLLYVVSEYTSNN